MSQPAGNFTASGKITPPSTASFAEMIGIRRELDEWQQAKRCRPAVIAPQIDLHPRGEITEPRLGCRRARAMIHLARMQIVIKDKLDIDIVQHADLEVHGCHIPRLRADTVRIVLRVVRKIHFQLEMTRIHCVRAFRFVWAIRRQLAHYLKRGWVEKIVPALVRRRLIRILIAPHPARTTQHSSTGTNTATRAIIGRLIWP